MAGPLSKKFKYLDDKGFGIGKGGVKYKRPLGKGTFSASAKPGKASAKWSMPIKDGGKGVMRGVKKLFGYEDGGIAIDPKNKGKFTAEAKKRGMTPLQLANAVLKNKDAYSKLMVQRAQFVLNASKFDK